MTNQIQTDNYYFTDKRSRLPFFFISAGLLRFGAAEQRSSGAAEQRSKRGCETPCLKQESAAISDFIVFYFVLLPKDAQGGRDFI